MKIEFNRVTWYSKLAALILFLIVIPVLCFYIGKQYGLLQTEYMSSSVMQSSAPATPGTVQMRGAATLPGNS